MSRLPDLERALVDAAARLDAGTLPTAEDAAGRGGLRDRWRRMSRRGHVAGVLVGAVALGAVATGSAQVAGLRPFQKMDRFQQFDRGLAPATTPGSGLQLRAPHGAARDWLARAYVSRDRRFCTTAGAANSFQTTLGCDGTSTVAQEILDPGYPGSVATSQALLAGTQMKPTRMIVFGVMRDGAPPPVIAVDGRTYRARVAPGVLRMHVNRDGGGMSPTGAALVATFPGELSLRLFAAEVPVTPPARDGLILAQAGDPAPGTAATIHVVASHAWNREHPGLERARVRRSDVLNRVPKPVKGVSRRLFRAVPAFGRARTAADVVPAKLVDRNLVNFHARAAESRRLRPEGPSAIGDVWVMPGRANGPFSAQWDAICLAGPRVIAGCLPIIPKQGFPGLQAVICSPGLDPDQRLLYGPVPPGATKARLTFDHGAPPREIPVRDLFAVATGRTDPLIRTVTWMGSEKPTTIRAAFPADTAKDQCARNRATGLRTLMRKLDGRGGDRSIVTTR